MRASSIGGHGIGLGQRRDIAARGARLRKPGRLVLKSTTGQVQRMQVEAHREPRQARRLRAESVAPLRRAGRIRRNRYAARRHRKTARSGRLTWRAWSFRRLDVGGVGAWVERRADQRQRRRIADRDRAAARQAVAESDQPRVLVWRHAAGIGPLVVQVLRPAEAVAQFDGATGPGPGQVDGEPLDRAQACPCAGAARSCRRRRRAASGSPLRCVVPSRSAR